MVLTGSIMAADSFQTIQYPAEGTFKEKGSKFLGFAIPVQTEDEIKMELDLLKKKYFDARHHCYAWILGAEKSRYRANDDGEPNHSAGDPILGQIRSHNLTDVLVVVVRYFGGTKLGVSGLIQAYRTAAYEALNHAEIIVKEVHDYFVIQFDYEVTADIMRVVKDFDITIITQEYDTVTRLKCSVKQKLALELKEKLRLLKVLGIKLEVEWSPTEIK